MSRHVLTTQTGLQEALKEFRFDPDTPLADKYEIMTHLFLEQAISAMVDMSAKDAMIAAGISTDKMQLLRGLPTEIKDSLPLIIRIAQKLAEENLTLTMLLNRIAKEIEA